MQFHLPYFLNTFRIDVMSVELLFSVATFASLKIDAECVHTKILMPNLS